MELQISHRAVSGIDPDAAPDAFSRTEVGGVLEALKPMFQGLDERQRATFGHLLFGRRPMHLALRGISAD